jgi:hypothetical protein
MADGTPAFRVRSESRSGPRTVLYAIGTRTRREPFWNGTLVPWGRMTLFSLSAAEYVRTVPVPVPGSSKEPEPGTELPHSRRENENRQEPERNAGTEFLRARWLGGWWTRPDRLRVCVYARVGPGRGLPAPPSQPVRHKVVSVSTVAADRQIDAPARPPNPPPATFSLPFTNRSKNLELRVETATRQVAHIGTAR